MTKIRKTIKNAFQFLVKTLKLKEPVALVL